MQLIKGKPITLLTIIMLVLVVIPISTTGDSTSEKSEECYGFILPVNQYQSNEMQMNISKLINELLRNDIDVYWLTNQIYVKSGILFINGSIEKNYFEKGSYLIPISDIEEINSDMLTILYKYTNNSDLNVHSLNEPINNIQVYKLNEPKIAYHNGPWLMNTYFTHLIRGGFETYDFLSWDEIPEKLNNEDYNVIIWGGRCISIKNFLTSFKDRLEYHKAYDKVRSFVASGGSYVGSCFGGYEVSFLSRSPINYLKPYFSNIPSMISLSFSESKVLGLPLTDTIITVEIVDHDCPISYGLPKEVTTLFSSKFVYSNSGENTNVVGKLKEFHYTNRTYTNGIKKIFDRLSIGSPLWITTDFGEGRVVGFSDHPEIAQYDIDSVGFTQIGNFSRITYNAIFYATSEGPFCKDFKTNENLTNIEYDTAADNKENDSDNSAPNKPRLYAYTSPIVRPKEIMLFIAQTEDIDGDLFTYKLLFSVDSIYNNVTDNILFASGENYAFYSYSWEVDIDYGTYNLKVQAVDIHGAESEWSDPVEITISRNPFISRIFHR